MKKLFLDLDAWLTSNLGLTPVHKILTVFAILVGIMIYLGYQFAFVDEKTPCSPGGYPVRCYHISQKLCEFTWAKSDKVCLDLVRKMGMPPGRPIGATVFKCQLIDLDKAFVYSRKSDPDCNDLFNNLEEWKRNNEFR